MKSFENYIVEHYGGVHSFDTLVGEGIPKLFLKIDSIKRKIKALQEERKLKYGGVYAKKVNEETDRSIKEKLIAPVKVITKEIKALEESLNQLTEMEDKYVSNLDKKYLSEIVKLPKSKNTKPKK